MSRQALLAELQQHEPWDSTEANHLTKMIRFMQENANCFERSLKSGHMTGSAWIVNEGKTHCMLVHHKKLNRWLQPGGHADGNQNIREVALNEALEETGIKSFIFPAGIFDVDVHQIPARPNEPAHFHYDVRFLFTINQDEMPVVSDESNDVKWVEINKLGSLTGNEASIMRLAEKLSL